VFFLVCVPATHRISYVIYLSSLSSLSPSTTVIFPLSLHDALPISAAIPPRNVLRLFSIARPLCFRLFSSGRIRAAAGREEAKTRSEEHTSELQSRENLVCRLLPEKKKKYKQY